MAEILNIKNSFSTAVTAVPGISTFMFDQLSGLNADLDKTFPICLLKIPSRANNPDIRRDWTNYEITFYVLDLRHQDDARELAEVYDEMRGYAEEVLIGLKTNTNDLQVSNKSISYEYGYDMFNDMLNGVQVTMELSAFYCHGLTYTEIIRFIEDGTEYLYEDGETKLLG